MATKKTKTTKPAPTPKAPASPHQRFAAKLDKYQTLLARRESLDARLTAERAKFSKILPK